MNAYCERLEESRRANLEEWNFWFPLEKNKQTHLENDTKNPISDFGDVPTENFFSSLVSWEAFVSYRRKDVKKCVRFAGFRESSGEKHIHNLTELRDILETADYDNRKNETGSGQNSQEEANQMCCLRRALNPNLDFSSPRPQH